MERWIVWYLPDKNNFPIQKFKVKNCVVILSLAIRQITSCQMETSSQNLVASAQFLVALVTSELQFRTLLQLYFTFFKEE